MPGIVGLISRQPRKQAEAQLAQMVAAMIHEPFYRSGTWVNEGLGIYVGWVARSESFSDGMPLENERGDLILTFSGEEYPEPDLAQRLKERGHTLSDHSSSYLVHVAEEDSRFPRSLNGRFHGLLVDRKSGAAKLFNDRFGMHRVYYHQSPDAFYFAAEAKAILAVKPSLRSVDPRGLGEFTACGCVLENRTLFKDVFVLPPGSAWSFREGLLAQKCNYFDSAEWENQGALDPDDYYNELRDVFSRNVPRYFAGQEQVGISLTGGLDTRMIMAWLTAPPNSLPSYTFVGPVRECQDVIIARKVAKLCQQPYEVIQIGSDFLSRFAHYAERTVFLSDGCTGVNRAADLYGNELAARIAPVRMTGNYGSEILRRLRAFKPGTVAAGLFQPELMSSIEEAKSTYNGLLGGHALSFIAFRQAPWYQYGLLSLEQTQLSVRSPFLDNDVVRTAFRAPKSEIVKTDIFEDSNECSRLIADGNPALSKIRTDRGLGGRGGWTEPLSRGWLEFTFRAEYAYDYGMPQWLARIDHRLSLLHLERVFLGRHKFCHYRVWYRDQLANYVREMLLDPRTLSRPYCTPEAVKRIVNEHLSGAANYTTDIHRLLTIELQHRLLIDCH
jgi:asparagine synthase (glutamine-hydrolysing)